MTHVIIGTAGHIDHGKTTLVKALTGRSTDTLKEEIKRGISINLGFTYFNLPGGKCAGIIDAPGHERFIKNMIAGAAGIDIIMLVVAANEGIMPQTVEHIDILSFLNIKEAVIVLTKCGASDEDMIELVEQDIRERTRNGFMENAPIVRVDSLSGAGLDKLSEILRELSDKIEERNAKAAARLYVDRVFSVKGFGSVVTGTLVEGKISVGDELELYPEGRRVRIRGVQVHEQNVGTAFAGQRTALNVAGVKASELTRGDVIAAAGSMSASDRLDVKISLIKHSPRKLRMWERLRIYHGSRELLARLVPLEADELRPGETDCLCQLRLEQPVCAKKGDKFVIRYYSPMETVGGGVVLDTNPKKHARFSSETIEALMLKDNRGLNDLIMDFIEGEGINGASVKRIAEAAGCAEDEARESADSLTEGGSLIRRGELVFGANAYSELLNGVLEKLSDFHAKNPLKSGMGKEELKSRLKTAAKPKLFDSFIALMCGQGHIKANDGIVALSGFTVVFDEKQTRIRDDINAKLEKSGFEAIDIKTLTNGSRAAQTVLEALVPELAVRLEGDLYISKKHYNDARDAALSIIDTNGNVTVKDFRDKLATSRKFALVLLEDFDKNKITKRVDDFRVRF